MKPILTLLLLVCFFWVDQVKAQEKRPNIVFIYADDWGWGDLSCHGNTWVKTPNIDRLVDEGIDFQQFNVLNPVCSPSRVGAFTGRYPARFGINHVFGAISKGPEQPDWLDVKAPNIARILQSAGYKTAHFGKWHMGDREDSPKIAEYGFDESEVYHGNGKKIKPHDIADRAVRFIKENKDKPFFMNVWIHESHTAHNPTPEAMELWKNESNEKKRIYGAVITDGDNNVGKVLKALDDAGISDNTLVVFASDNGPESTGTIAKKGKIGRYGSYYSIGETAGLRGRKRSLFEGGIRTPFIVRWPGHTTPGMKNDTTVFTAVDLLPTFCAAAGVPVPSNVKCDGENLIEAFNSKPIARTRTIYWLHTGKKSDPDWWPRLAVREGDWKLVTTFDGKRTELHNMKSDRYEKDDTDLSKKYPEITERLTKLAFKWYETLPKKADPSCLSHIPEIKNKKAKHKK